MKVRERGGGQEEEEEEEEEGTRGSLKEEKKRSVRTGKEMGGAGGKGRVVCQEGDWEK